MRKVYLVCSLLLAFTASMFGMGCGGDAAKPKTDAPKTDAKKSDAPKTDAKPAEGAKEEPKKGFWDRVRGIFGGK